jgi:hypothetical protein
MKIKHLGVQKFVQVQKFGRWIARNCPFCLKLPEKMGPEIVKKVAFSCKKARENASKNDRLTVS